MIEVVVGTRPEIIKVAPVLRALSQLVTVHHSGQHYTTELSRVFEAEFGFQPDVRMRPVADLQWHEQMGRLLVNAYENLEGPVVLVQGDTNTTLAYAMAARQKKLQVIHLEAGLRSNDDIVENRNRVAISDLAHLHLTISEIGRQNLLREGISDGQIVYVGSTAVDHALGMIGGYQAVVLERHAVVTIHRAESVSGERLTEIHKGLTTAGFSFDWYAHPRTWQTLDGLGIGYHKPVGYQDFLRACANADVVVSDSGGVAEEMTVFGRPVVQIRRDTERPEMLGNGMMLAWGADEIAEAILTLSAEYEHGVFSTPYGLGGAAVAAAQAINEFLR